MSRFFIGVDGGGPGCRARVEAEDGTLIGEGTGGPAQLNQGPTVAWHSIQTAIEAALGNSGFQPGDAQLGFGLAGAHVGAWRAAFENAIRPSSLNRHSLCARASSLGRSYPPGTPPTARR